MSREEHRFEELLALHCAPVLKKKKTAGMFHIRKEELPELQEIVDEYREKLKQHHIELRILQADEDRVTIYVYQRERLAVLMQHSKIRQFLSKYGYPQEDLESCLQYLDQRLKNAQYPHEIGLFLGYPLEDVIGFIEQADCRFIGYWKVYHHEAAKRRLFSCFDQCILELSRGVLQGQCIEQLI